MSGDEGSPLPSFSIVIETANLELADHWRLEASLASIAAQQPSPQKAREVVLIDSGDAPLGLFPPLLEKYPWLTLHSIEPGIDYGDQKSLTASLVSGEVVLLADSDCIYEPDWIGSVLSTFADHPEIGVIAGETTVRIEDPYTLAIALIFFFPRFSNQTEVAPARGFYGNNVAFRRQVLLDCPFPAGLSIFRGQNVIYSRMLYLAGIPIWRLPLSRSWHAPPDGFPAALARLFQTGRDTPRLARMDTPPPGAPYQGDYEPYDRTGGRVRKVVERVRAIWKQEPVQLLWLPLALPIAAACVGAFFLGSMTERMFHSAYGNPPTQPGVDAAK